MRLAFNEQQGMLQNQVRSLCRERADADVLRQLITDKLPWSEALWKTMAELGFQAARIPEELGGVSLGIKDLCAIAEELGRAVAPVPFFSSSCMATEAISLAGSAEQQQRWLPKLASAEKVATLAHANISGDPERAASGVIFDGHTLNGQKSPVPDLVVCDWLLVIASSRDQPVITFVNLAQARPEVASLNGFDELRQHCSVTFEDTPCEVLEGPQGAEVVKELFCRMAVVAAFEQLGGAEAAMLMARDYTMERYVFGRQLASYQAVKHKLANILSMIEINRSNALYAASRLEQDADDRFIAAATARLGATALYEHAARENLQLHGGIGFTWEANCHFHYRRARLLSQHLGGPSVWQRILIDELRRQTA